MRLKTLETTILSMIACWDIDATHADSGVGGGACYVTKKAIQRALGGKWTSHRDSTLQGLVTKGLLKKMQYFDMVGYSITPKGQEKYYSKCALSDADYFFEDVAIRDMMQAIKDVG